MCNKLIQVLIEDAGIHQTCRYSALFSKAAITLHVTFHKDSVTTHLRCDWIFPDHFIDCEFTAIVSVKIFRKPVAV